jgi:F0F1-type ATP synthase assembly protein I
VKKGTAASLAWNLSWTMLFSLLIPLLGGVWLDKKLGTAPLFTLIGAVLGILAATVGVARIALRTFSQTGDEEPGHPRGENDKEEPD